MKNYIKTAIAAGAVCASVVMGGRADATTFIFEKEMVNGWTITGEVEGDLADDMNTVENATLNWWKVLDEGETLLLDSEDEKYENAQSNVTGFTLDGEDVNIFMYSQASAEPIVASVYSYQNGNIVQGTKSNGWELINIAHSVNSIGEGDYRTEDMVNIYDLLLPSSVDQEIFKVEPTTPGYDWKWTATQSEEIAPVPEPSLILGSMLALAAGAKVLKRKNKK